MTKLAYIIGCPALGLIEAVADAALAAERLESLGWKIAACVPSPLLSFQDWLEVPKLLHGADVAMLYYSGHGYSRKMGGAIETGLYSGVPIPHAWLTQNVIGPLRASTQCNSLVP
jgi:hypothetical protein